MRKTILLALLALSGTAQARGFTAEELATAAKGPTIAVPDVARQVSEATEQLRLGIAYDPVLGVGTRTKEEQIALIGALGMGQGIGDLRAKWFMAGAIQQPPYGPSTALYNPLARGWLVLHWEKAGDAWQIKSAYLGSAGPSDWISASGPYLGSLVSDYVTARTHLGGLPAAQAGMEADRWIAGLAVAMHDPALRARIDDARKSIVAGQTKKLGGGAIDLMPGRARATFWPVAAFKRADGGQSALFGSAVFPQILIAADFTAGAAPALKRLTLVNLDNAGESK